MTQTEINYKNGSTGKFRSARRQIGTQNEIRIISEIAYVLAQQGRIRESIILFEGLLAVAPATAYFQAALGALFLRLKNFPQAIEYLDAVLEIEPNNITALVNRGEAHLLSGDLISAQKDLEKAIKISAQKSSLKTDFSDETALAVKRANALLQVHQQK